ncbi:MAG: hypothetical protein LIO46_04425 [Clostridiales bacterium]|nr:hypothetical protein [Clostridiales bacterium]
MKPPSVIFNFVHCAEMHSFFFLTHLGVVRDNGPPYNEDAVKHTALHTDGLMLFAFGVRIVLSECPDGLGDCPYRIVPGSRLRASYIPFHFTGDSKFH